MKKILLALTVLLFSSGCGIFVPIIGSIKEAGFTQSDREELLQKTVKNFNDLESSRTPEKAAQYAKDDIKYKFANELRTRAKKERIVESNIDNVDIHEGSWKATLTRNVRYYVISQYVIKDRIEIDEWEFISPSSGWKISARKEAINE